jgi:hypothetical protein
MTETKIPRDVREAIDVLISHANHCGMQSACDTTAAQSAHAFDGRDAAQAALESAIARHLPSTCDGCAYGAAWSLRIANCLHCKRLLRNDHYTPADWGEGEQDGI